MPSVDLGSAHGKVEIDVSGVDKSTQQAGAQMKGMGKHAHDASMDIQMAGMVIAAAGAVISAAFVKAAETAIEFDKNMHNVNSIAKLSEGQFKKLEKSILNMSTRLPQSINELAEGLYDVYSSGFKGKTALKVLEVAAMGASAGLTDTATSAKALMAVMNAYNQKTGPDAKRIMDLMFTTVDKGVVTFEELANSIGTVVSTSATAKIPFEEVSAAIALMTLSGINASEATTALNQTILHMIRPTDEAAGKAEELGLKWFNSAEGANHLKEVGLAKALDEIRVATHGDIGAMAQLMPEVRGLKGMLALTKNEGKDFNAMLGEMKNSAGKTQRALEEQSKSTAYQLQILKNYLTVLATSVMLKVLPALNMLIKGLQGVAEWLMKQPAWVRSVIGVYFALIAVLLSATGSAMLFSSSLGMVNKGLAAMTMQGGLAAGAVTWLSTALKALVSWPVALFLAAGAASEWARQKFEWFARAVMIIGGPIGIVNEYIRSLIGMTSELSKTDEAHAKGSTKNAAEIKAAEDIKKAAKLAAKTQADEAAKAEQAQLEAEQLTAIARGALYVQDQLAREALTSAIQNSSKEQIEAFQKAQEKFYEWVGIFEEVPEKLKITGQELLKRLQEQVTSFNQWADNIKALSSRVPPEMLNELKKLGPQAAGQIEALKNLSDAELAKYVELWRQKHAQAIEASKSELAAGTPGVKEAGGKVGQANIDGVTEKIEKGKEAIRNVASGTAGVLDEYGLKETASKGGSSIGSTWADSIAAAIRANKTVSSAISWIKGFLGGSLPEIGPLANGVLDKGGHDIGKAWVEGINKAIAATALNLAPVQMALATPAPVPQQVMAPTVNVQMSQPAQAQPGNISIAATIQEEADATLLARQIAWQMSTRGR